MTRFSQELFDRICDRIANGESLRKICRDEDMPGPRTVWEWLAKNDDLAQQYARARKDQADAIFDECLDIADNAEDPQLARLRIDTRKWMAGKLRPKKYGDKLDVTSGGERIEGAVVTFHAPET